jgi:hypothetical protein
MTPCHSSKTIIDFLSYLSQTKRQDAIAMEEPHET